jgi:DUF438 domain-containing protein
MSEFTYHKETRKKQLIELFNGILKGENLGQLVAENQKLINSCIPSDVISLVDQLVLMNIPMPDLKKGINKLMNLLHKIISEYPYYPPVKESFIGCLVENNRILDELLRKFRPLIREINKSPENEELRNSLKERFLEIEKFNNYYLIKENILFPLIEKHVPEFRCLSVMWSFHDDIKRNLKLAIEQLESEGSDLKIFNRLVGDFFFNV